MLGVLAMIHDDATDWKVKSLKMLTNKLGPADCHERGGGGWARNWRYVELRVGHARTCPSCPDILHSLQGVLSLSLHFLLAFLNSSFCRFQVGMERISLHTMVKSRTRTWLRMSSCETKLSCHIININHSPLQNIEKGFFMRSGEIWWGTAALAAMTAILGSSALLALNR